MASFRRVVVIVMLVMLIISLTITGIAISAGAKKLDMKAASCPDYWVDSSPDNPGSKCVNAHKLGTCNLPTSKTDLNPADFTTDTFTGSNADCAKRSWAQACGVVWSGISEKTDC